MIELAFLLALSSSSRASAPSSRPSSGYSAPAPKSTVTPKPSPRPSQSPSKPSTAQPDHPSISSPKSSQVGRAQLKSSTPVPNAHEFQGKSYSASQSQYTNHSGLWVWYWLFVPSPFGDKKEIQCFDEKHKRIDCDRDDKSWQRDW